jgi:hypothetical protein
MSCDHFTVSRRPLPIRFESCLLSMLWLRTEFTAKRKFNQAPQWFGDEMVFYKNDFCSVTWHG